MADDQRPGHGPPGEAKVALYNTRTHRVEPLRTVEPGRVRLYVCGVSVSGPPHVGHARSYIVFDVLRRVLEHAGYEVDHAQNFTDIEDSITRRAEEAGLSVKAFSDRMIEQYFDAMDRLAIQRAHHYPRVTEYIDRIIDATERLQDHECAYRLPDGVAFRICDIPDFGGLLGRDPAEAVVEAVPVEAWNGRESPFDFVLWRNDDQMGMKWDTPWGRGRPGWHTECAVMATSILGDQVDIHGGGVDLVFPHHESERAIARCLTGKRFAGVWMHNGLVTMDREKMSKSLSNYVTLAEAIDQHGAATIRLAAMLEPYRQTLEWTDHLVSRARELVRTLETALEQSPGGEPTGHVAALHDELLRQLRTDLDLPGAVRTLSELAHYYRKDPGARPAMAEALTLLGLAELSPFRALLDEGA